jgi:pyruvate/2-oxoacid:ferredoxin oxidoreductase alpha subunit
VVEAYSEYANKYRVDPKTGKNNFAIVQAEDELAAIGMVIGANWNGARSFTATSGPGVSLMNEFLGLAYFAEIPTLLIDVQRSGPSTGMPTRTQQSDITIAAYASHGDTKQVLVIPSTPKECFDLTADSLDLAEHLQTPIIMLTDLDLGMNDHVSEPFVWDDNRKYNRGKVLNAEELEKMGRFGRYLDVDNDGVTYRTYPGTHPTKGSFFTRGTSRDEYAVYTEDSGAYVQNMERLQLKWETAKTLVPSPIVYQEKNKSNIGFIFFGTTLFAAEESMDMLAENNITIDALRLRAFPFNNQVSDFIESHQTIVVIEQNRDAQMRSLLINELNCNPSKIKSILNVNSNQLKVASIGARDFLSIDTTNIKSYVGDQIVWIATIPIIQLEILSKIKLQSNRVIIEKPFATNSKELKSFINLINESKNTLFLSEPWRHSKTWEFIKNKITKQNSLQSIVIYRGGPNIRTYMNPVWDWIQHDLGLVGELLKEYQGEIEIEFKWLNGGKTLNLNINSSNRFNIEINLGYFSERVEFWEINGKEKVNFNSNQNSDDHPIYTMYEYVSRKNFTNNLIEQCWLTNKVIRLLDN